jgi:hypothetical protein
MSVSGVVRPSRSTMGSITRTPTKRRREDDEDAAENLNTPTKSRRSNLPGLSLKAASLASRIPDEQTINPGPARSPAYVAELLLSLPRMMLVPPTHAAYEQALCLSFLALRRAVRFGDALDANVLCRAWTALAEVGLQAAAGSRAAGSWPWTQGIEAVIENATTNGLAIAKKHPSLSHFRLRLAILSAQFSLLQNNVKLARTTFRRFLTTLLPTDPSWMVYTAHLNLIFALLVPAISSSVSTSSAYNALQFHDAQLLSPQSELSTRELNVALTAIQALHELATANRHPIVASLARVLHLRVLMRHSLWARVGAALRDAEQALDEISPLPVQCPPMNPAQSTATAATASMPAPSHSSASFKPKQEPMPPSLPLRTRDQNTSTTNGVEYLPSPPPSDAPTLDIVNPCRLTRSSSPPPTSTSASTHVGTTTTVTSQSVTVSPAPLATSSTYSDTVATLAALRAHTLLVGVLYFTYAGESENANTRLKALHAILDGGVLTGDGKDGTGAAKGEERGHEDDTRAWGMYKIHLSYPPRSSSTTSASSSAPSPSSFNAASSPSTPDPHCQPLIITLTHPRILVVLSYLVSAMAKRDPGGRKPRKKVFALEGLRIWEKEWRDWGSGANSGGTRALSCEYQCQHDVLFNRLANVFLVPPWATMHELNSLQRTMETLKADLLVEVVSVRSYLILFYLFSSLSSTLRTSRNLYPSLSRT